MTTRALALAAAAAMIGGAAGLAAPVHAAEVAEPEIRRVIVEDDQVRIEELRVRGQVQQVVISNKKIAAPAYQILVPRGGPQQRERDAAGQRVWQLVTF